MVDFINQNFGSWKPNLVRALYPYPSCNETLSYPISKTGTILDKLLWKHPTSGGFKVHKAYSLLEKDYNSTCSNQHRYNSIPHDVWTLIYKVKLPLKMGNFVWKLMHDCIPTFLAFKNKGIPIQSTCPLCSSEDETTLHLFLYCPFAWAIWHGTLLVVHTSKLNNLYVQS